MNELPKLEDSVDMHAPSLSSAEFEWRPSMVLVPDDASRSSHWACHLPFAYWLVDVLRPLHVVDLGKEPGGAFLGFCRAADWLRLSNTCYALTISDLDGTGQAQEVRKDLTERPPVVTHDPAATARKVWFESSLAPALDKFADGSVGLLHLSDLETSEAAERLLGAWLPKMSRQGVILIDDILEAPDDMWAFWLSASHRFPSFLFPHGGGLGVLAIGSDVPEPLRQLFAAASRGDEGHSAICALFERLGSAAEAIDARKAVEDSRSRWAELVHLKAQLAGLRSSTSWRVTGPLRALGEGLKKLKRSVRHTVQRTAPATGSADAYQQWIKQYDTLGPLDVLAIQNHIARMKWRPKLSVVMPVYNIAETYLRKALDTVLEQLYEDWELCIADDASTKPHVAQVLAEYAARDPRVKVAYRQENGHVAVASNTALALATGDFVVLMDHDDELPRHALYMIAAELERYPDADIIYSDEDKIDAKGNRWDPYFKSDWNPDLVCGQNMVSHIGVYRRSLLGEIGGFRQGFEGSQDYDLMLRAVERTTSCQIRHIPFILYHWRVFPESGSISTDNLDKATNAARRAVAEHLARTGTSATVEASTQSPDYSRVRHPLPDPLPTVSLIVPTKDKADLLKGCVDSLLHRTDYDNLEVLIVDNGSQEAKTFAYFRSLEGEDRVRILTYGGPFNYSAINNFAVSQARGSVIGLINNDIVVITRDWLKEMVSHALRPQVGAVGAKLFYADETIQHAGVILGMGGVAGHPFRQFPRGSFYFQRPNLAQNLSAVTAACLVVRKEVYLQAGGLDEVNLAVAFNDVDFCVRLREAGYLNVWTPFAELYHLESASRGSDLSPANLQRFKREIAYMENRWGPALANDPYYNPNLTLDRWDFSYAFPPRVVKPWKRQGPRR